MNQHLHSHHILLQEIIRAPFSLGEWSGQGLQLGGVGRGETSGPHLHGRNRYSCRGALFFQGLLERGSSGTHFHGGSYLAIIFWDLQIEEITSSPFQRRFFRQGFFSGAFGQRILRALFLRRLWTGSPFQVHQEGDHNATFFRAHLLQY